MAMLFESLDHPPGPSFSLAIKAFHVLGSDGKAYGRRLKTDAPTALYQGPSQDNVFANDGWPALVSPQQFCPKRAKRFLRDQRSLIKRLLSFGGCDAGEVIPLLQARHECGTGVLNEHTDCNRCGIRGVSQTARKD